VFLLEVVVPPILVPTSTNTLRIPIIKNKLSRLAIRIFRLIKRKLTEFVCSQENWG
jgi:hypothetical protein